MKGNPSTINNDLEFLPRCIVCNGVGNRNSVCPSVCLTVCRTRELWQNEST